MEGAGVGWSLLNSGGHLLTEIPDMFFGGRVEGEIEIVEGTADFGRIKYKTTRSGFDWLVNLFIHQNVTVDSQSREPQ